MKTILDRSIIFFIISVTNQMRNKYLKLPLIFLLSFFIVYNVSGAVTDDYSLPYIPYDNITIDCGSSGVNLSPDNRIWSGDIDSRILRMQNGKNETASTVSKASVPKEVPYETARFFLSEFTYTLPVTPGPKFVRLLFYPAKYADFDASKAFFSVKASHYSLLTNFSASLTADALRAETFQKEFCINSAEDNLNITFAPVSSSFAFINGIEVISMPSDLYYTATEGHGAKIVGSSEIDQYYPIKNDTALEMVYRVNVGGSSISAVHDSGTYRAWEQDEQYLTIRKYSRLPVNLTHIISYTKENPAYIAPIGVYQTARSMGNVDRALVLSYNLTWGFPVDSSYNYLVRLHFCEIEPEITEANQRVFNIYITNQTAESRASVIKWGGHNFVPVHKDYVFQILAKSGEKKQNLSVALQAIGTGYNGTIADAILNGVEILKLSSTDGNLAGPNPDPTIAGPNADEPSNGQHSSNDKNGRRIGILSGVVSGVVLISIIVGFFIFRRVRRVKKSASVEGTSKREPFQFNMTKSTVSRGSSNLPSDLCRYFSLAEIRAATNNFDDLFIIGSGGFGNVYKGYIDSGTTAVAIKRLKPESSQGAHEFKTEIEMLSQLRHLHLVSLVGYCNDGREMILVYEFMARGTLREHLYNSDNPPLSWNKRLEICIGAAKGLHYLHTGAMHTIIHRDVKSTNILLDEKWEAKVSDFGLSRLGPTGKSKAHVSTVVKGSLGYLDPEYYKRQQLTEKSDVYSFGVVLCEALFGRPPLMRSVEKNQVSLAGWARSCYQSGTLNEIVDKHLRGSIAPECLRKYGEIAASCLVDNGSERPSMNDVVWGLEFALQLQKSAEESTGVDEHLAWEMKCGDEVALNNNKQSEDEEKFTSSWGSTSEILRSGVTKTSSSEQSSETNKSIKRMSGSVFSEINLPLPR